MANNPETVPGATPSTDQRRPAPLLRLPDHNDLPERWGEPNRLAGVRLPDDNDLPDHNGTFVKNSQEHLQRVLLTVCIAPVLRRLHPDGKYFIGQDVDIYWRLP